MNAGISFDKACLDDQDRLIIDPQNQVNCINLALAAECIRELSLLYLSKISMIFPIHSVYILDINLFINLGFLFLSLFFTKLAIQPITQMFLVKKDVKFIKNLGIWAIFYLYNLWILKTSTHPTNGEEATNIQIIELIINISIIPLTEEFIYRGTICRLLSLRFGTLNGLVISSMIFGLNHKNCTILIHHFFSAMAFGLVYIRTRMLWTSIVAHAIQNLLTYI